MQKNAVSKASRAKIFLKFLQLGWPNITFWTWEFLFNVPLIKIYPTVLRKVGLAPTTVVLYVGQAISFVAAYLSSIYGHRTGVLTRMRVKEVREAVGDEERGYLINVMEHKTVRKFGTAQLYLEAEEYGWFRNWLRLRSRAVPTNPFFFSSLGRGEGEDLICYFRMAWAEMGLKGACALWSTLNNVLFPQ
ncbi:hypothetical protein D5F01_LYC23780 [Larimichthys crocea]|uniref:Uncharacterized protein n=1 Tax=Larimichthys crocea TaxID=215358 RepID=A0A6G0HG30_LARCR|nr:hypothetical protein D5F01_LYC23780 [Larimichthys crocea]